MDYRTRSAHLAESTNQVQNPSLLVFIYSSPLIATAAFISIIIYFQNPSFSFSIATLSTSSPPRSSTFSNAVLACLDIACFDVSITASSSIAVTASPWNPIATSLPNPSTYLLPPVSYRLQPTTYHLLTREGRLVCFNHFFFVTFFCSCLNLRLFQDWLSIDNSMKNVTGGSLQKFRLHFLLQRPIVILNAIQLFDIISHRNYQLSITHERLPKWLMWIWLFFLRDLGHLFVLSGSIQLDAYNIYYR